MITKKKVLSHILWGGIFGLIGGIIVSYDRFIIAQIYNIPVHKINIFSYYIQFPQTVVSDMFWYFEKNILKLVNLIIPGIFIGATLGVADKSVRKGFYSVFGGILGATLYHVLRQKTELTMLLFPGIYAIPIGLFIGIAYKSFKKAILGISGGIIGAITVLIFCLAFTIFVLGRFPFMDISSGRSFLPDEILEILTVTLTVLLIPLGIFIGTELGEQKSQ